jgi:membrane fusion protein
MQQAKGALPARRGAFPAPSAHTAPTSTEPTLFRPEVLAARRTQWLGTVIVAPRATHRAFTLFAILAAAALVAFACLAPYTRSVRINGQLVPSAGVIRVLAPRAGIITAIHVTEGTQVRAGDRLLTLSDELHSSALGGTQAQITRQLAGRRESLLLEQRQQARLLAQQELALGQRVNALRAEQAQIEREIELLRSRVAVASRAEDLHRKLRDTAFISDMRLQQVESETIEQRARVAALERSRLTLARERLVLEAELSDLPLKAQREAAALERSVAQIAQEQAEAEARREIVITAPHDGVVTAIQAVAGAIPAGAVPLLSIVPSNSQLEAHLYSPSRAVGFLREGQTVALRYQPFPYQKFGHHLGVVTSVSRSAVSPAELPPQIAGLAGGVGAASPGAGIEPIYRVTVRLPRETVTAYGEALPLQPGMALEADVALERRRLYEWVLDPLYTVTGRLQG